MADDKLTNWWGGLAPVEKLVVGMFGSVAVGIVAAVGITMSARSGSGDGKSGFLKFQKFVAITNIVWQFLDPMIKKNVSGEVMEKGRYAIDQVLDLLNIFATSDKLVKLF